MQINFIRLLLLCFALFTQSIYASPLDLLAESSAANPNHSGVTVLEKGEASLLARAWLTDKALSTIHVQYFIWSTDNVGTLASEALIRAADRGIKVKVIVDDLMIDAEPKTLLSLAVHPNVEIKIYNPKHSVGTSFIERVWHMFTDFRGFNQRMHDKTAIFDSRIGITGGRNMADEYYDYNQEYNFRDRDVLLAGAVVDEMELSFQRFWQSPLSVSLETLLADERDDLTNASVQAYRQWLDSYARAPENYSPEVRDIFNSLEQKFPQLLKDMRWVPVTFVSDYPGKNDSQNGLEGGGQSTSALVELIQSAQHSVTIQSPYLVLPEGGLALFSDLIKRGVKVRISTNSLASTDNIHAFSGYYKQRQAILDAGIKVYEYKPHPEIMRSLIDRFTALETKAPLFAVHAKTLVVDGQTVFIGTFNLDPRSTHLNTEVGVIIRNPTISQAVETSIETDMSAANSWEAAIDNSGNDVPFTTRLNLWFWSLLPLESIL